MSASEKEMLERAVRKAQERVSKLERERAEMKQKNIQKEWGRIEKEREQQAKDEAAWVVLGDEFDEWEMIEINK